ncbi:PREDICTED: uncharacterized protein LOC109171669 [Ipomoea nil]|uniref:uncharacterized protein LOC109171669 n=1 Tax=Ipomoea nil TaxID=35883 RepID=UPI0009011651|nr:PREDICTED: uncharacterized protein LOC109171669 [Ipomoea nil]
MKVTSKSRGRSVTPDLQNVPVVVPESPDTCVYKPQFVSNAAQDKWSTMVRRELIIQRSVDENQLNSVCDVLPLMSEVGLLQTVTSVCNYSKLLSYKFYYNLNDEIDILPSERYKQIFILGKWYMFGPDVIKQYYGLKRVEEDEISNWDLVAKTLTGGLPLYGQLVIMIPCPALNSPSISKHLAALLFRVGTKMTIDLGKWIFYHILTLIHPKEQKIKLPYPNLIFGVLTSLGLIPMPSEVIAPSLLYTVDPRLLTGKHIRDVTPIDALHTSEADATVEDTPYAQDVQLSLPLKLNAARTELATVLLRMSLSESAAGDAVKSEFFYCLTCPLSIICKKGEYYTKRENLCL